MVVPRKQLRRRLTSLLNLIRHPVSTAPALREVAQGAEEGIEEEKVPVSGQAVEAANVAE